MTRIALAFSLMLGLFPLCASANEAIRSVISRQMDAFQADDFGTAFTFASPSIKRIFGNSENFGRMVREGYPMVWRPADISFGALEDRSGRLVQRVLIRDSSGRLHVAEYEMIETDRGWEINGVQILRAPELGA